MIHQWDFGVDTNPAEDIRAHKDLIKEAEKSLSYAIAQQDREKITRLYQEVNWRRQEIERLRFILGSRVSA